MKHPPRLNSHHGARLRAGSRDGYGSWAVTRSRSRCVENLPPRSSCSACTYCRRPLSRPDMSGAAHGQPRVASRGASLACVARSQEAARDAAQRTQTTLAPMKMGVALAYSLRSAHFILVASSEPLRVDRSDPRRALSLIGDDSFVSLRDRNLILRAEIEISP